jgi:hypothetical protein
MIEDPDRLTSPVEKRPHTMADVFTYCLAQQRKPHDRTREKVRGFERVIDRGLWSRYLLVNRYVNRDTPGGKETVAVEGFLLDVAPEHPALVGSFRYPDRFNSASDTRQDRDKYLSEVLGGRFAPEFGPRADPRRGDIELVTFLVVAWTVLLGIVLIASIPTAVVFRRQQRRLEAIKERGEYPDELRCPVCLEMTDSLKHFAMARYGYFLGVAAGAERETVTACPRCMRRHIRKRFWVNLIPANLLMLGLGPMYLVQWLRTFRRGHSPGAIEPAGEAVEPVSSPAPERKW